MSSKWKYADLPAQTRLDMLKNGNKDLYDEEVARTKEVMDARREVGLDTDAQEKWIDNVGYNYNLYLAKNAGESSNNVSKTGYANIYYTPKDRSSTGGKIKPNTTRTALSIATEYINNAAKSAGDEVRKKYEALKKQTDEELSEMSPVVREMLINSGASLEGGRFKQYYADMRKKLDMVYAEYDKAMDAEIENINKIYSQMANKLSEYRDGGIEDLSLLSIANNLVNAFKQTGNITYPKLSALKVETSEDEKTQAFIPKEAPKATEQNKSEEPKEEKQTQTGNVYEAAEKSALEKAKSNAMYSILSALDDLTSENIKKAFVNMGFTRENANAILKRIQENAAQKMTTK